MDCIFCKIANKEIPKEFNYEDDEVMVFADINPVRDVHLLIVPKKHVAEVMAAQDTSLFQKLFSVAQKMIKEQKLTDRGYRLVINGGGAQIVHHLHIHFMGPIKSNAAL